MPLEPSLRDVLDSSQRSQALEEGQSIEDVPGTPAVAPIDIPEDVPVPPGEEGRFRMQEGVTQPPTQPAAGQEGQDLNSILRGGEKKPDASTKVFGKAVVGGAVRGSGVVPATMIGARAGAMVPPPLQALTVPLGALVGFGIGAFAGDMAATNLEERGLAINPIDLSEEQRPIGIFGELIGAGFTAGGVTLGTAKSGVRLAESGVGSAVNSILNYAARNPSKFALFESAAVISSATAEGFFEIVRPGRPLERMGVGIAAGLINPVNVTVQAGERIGSVVLRHFQKLTPGGRRSVAAKELDRIIQAAGGDPETLIRALEDGQALAEAVPDFRPRSAAAISNDPVLQRIEANLAELDRTFFGDRAISIERSQRALANVIDLLDMTGDPAALRAAGVLRRQRWTVTLERLVGYAEVEARQAAQAIARRGAPADEAARGVQEAEVSKQALEIFERNLELARTAERTLWERALGGRNTRGAHTTQRRVLNRLQGEATELIPVPESVQQRIAAVANAEDVVRRAAQTGTLEDGTKITKAMLSKAENELSVGRMLDFRRDLLRLARGQARSTDPKADSLSRTFGLMAEAVLDDLVRTGAATRVGQVEAPGSRFGLPTGAPRQVRRGAGGQFTEATPLDEARTFTRSLNDVYTRSFGGRLSQETAFGMNVPPETTLRRAMASGREAAAMKMRELEEAVSFLPEIVRETSPELAVQIQENAKIFMDLQARFVRLLADETRDFQGVVSVKGMRTFIQRNDAVLAKFPALRRDLEAAASTQERLTEWTRRVKGLHREIDKGALGKLVNSDSPTDVIRGMLSSSQPITNLDRLEGIAKAGGPQAMAGLRVALWEVILNRAGANTGQLNLGQLIRALDSPVRPGLPSLREWMTAKNIMPKDTLDFIDEVVTMNNNLQQTLATRATGEEVITRPNMLLNLFNRMVGSELARKGLKVFQQATGSQERATATSLIVGYRGSQAMQEFVERIPSLKIQGILVDAFSGAPLNPGGEPFSLLREMLSTAATAQQQAQVVARLHAYALTSAALGAEDEVTLGFPSFDTDSGPEQPEIPSFLRDASGGVPPGESDALQPNVPGGAGLRQVADRDVPFSDELQEQAAQPAQDPREDPQTGGVPGLNADETAQVAADLRSDEGFRSRPYRDSEGVWTIGYGENLEARSTATGSELTTEDLRNMRITREEANSLMLDRVEQISSELQSRLKFWDKLSSRQRRALINMGYQLGVTELLKFKAIDALRKGNAEKAAELAADTKWAREQTPQRAQRVLGMIRSGKR